MKLHQRLFIKQGLKLARIGSKGQENRNQEKLSKSKRKIMDSTSFRQVTTERN
jgi:hypothetical protein